MCTISSAIEHLTQEQLRNPDHFKAHYLGLYLDAGRIKEEITVNPNVSEDLKQFSQTLTTILSRGFDKPLLFDNGVYNLQSNSEAYAKLFDSLWEMSTKYIQEICQK